MNTTMGKKRKYLQTFNDFTLGQFLGTNTYYCKGIIFGGLSFEGNLEKQDNILSLVSHTETKETRKITVATKNNYGIRELEAGIVSLLFEAQ